MNRGFRASQVLEARLLPRALATYYLRAVAASSRGGNGATSMARPRELKALLGIARDCRDVVEFGPGDLVAPVVLALADPSRKVTAFRDQGSGAGDRLLAIAEPGVRSRVEVRAGSLDGGSSSTEPACLAVIDGSADAADVREAFESFRRMVRPEGLIAVHRAGADGVVRRLESELGIDLQAAGEGLFVWRKPLEPVEPVEPAEPAAPPAPERRRSARWPALALATVGVAVGLGVGVLTTGNGDDAKNTTGAATPAASPPQSGGVHARKARDQRARSARAKERGTTGAERSGTQARGSGAPGGSVMRLSGVGTKRFGSLRIRRSSALRWSSDGGPFSIKSSGFQLDTPAPTGEAVLSRGTYRDFRVSGAGSWRVVIRPI